MLSKLLTATTAEVKPVAWRRGPPAAPNGHGGRPHDELSLLRARLAEMETAAREQANQAHEAGVRAGEAAARQALDGEVRQALERLAATMAEVAATRGDTMRRAEADTVRLAAAIARRVLHRELTVAPDALEALVRAAIEKLQSQEICRVRVHPGQETVVRACLDQTGRGQGVEVVADASQPPGGILFDISRGILDASLETQWEEIERSLADQLETRL